MRLTSGMNLDLDVGVAVSDLADERFELRLVCPREERQDLPATVEKPLGHGAGDRVEVVWLVQQECCRFVWAEHSAADDRPVRCAVKRPEASGMPILPATPPPERAP